MLVAYYVYKHWHKQGLTRLESFCMMIAVQSYAHRRQKGKTALEAGAIERISTFAKAAAEPPKEAQDASE